MQLVGDSRLRIRDVDISWPGGTHDARVWRNSLAKTIMERQGKVFVAADSAYPISRWLMKPYLPADTPQKIRFNKALTGCRTVSTECIFGTYVVSE